MACPAHPVSDGDVNMAAPTNRQEWVCEGCGLSGTTEYEVKDVLSVFRALRDHHERLASKYAPLCHFDPDQVRVRNPEMIDEYAWNRLVGEIERKCGIR
jgi:hypothetical protein